MSALADLLSSGIVRTVLMGAAILGAISGMLGAFAVLRRQSLLGDALSHAALPGICLGFIIAGTRDLGSILMGAFVTGALAALVMMLIVRRTTLKTDAALGIVLSVFFAVGVVLLSWVQGQGGAASAGLASFLFGQAAAILRSDLWIMGGIGLTALALVLALWKEFKLVSFDADFARAQGFPVTGLEAVLTVMVALAIVVGLQLVGVVLMVALLIAPAAAARQWTRTLGPMVVLSAVIGAASGAAGALISAASRGLATGPVVVLIATGIVIVSLLFAPQRGLIWQALAKRRARARISDGRVLTTLQGLAAAHSDANYPAEQGMLEAALGTRAPSATIAALEQRGLIQPVTHPPETTPHWELTAAGHIEAAALSGKHSPKSDEGTQ
ncbi:metal ABC transporter permease [Roseinatronobacter bogoriensis]|uniref:ABC transporter n=1 Tax=Roseinatronobacter bogoriensis subsp. barguzinensis TaxID=441209 RepID=A0A2K8K6D1_9RHOB|nr:MULTISPECIES: metal ABC transporter permease [Rhodobaca]ATX65007.1 ABC transporter [Rhodobaca barguzinensis]MBB4208830.1 manganese/zinc/iron transport system permease protein [Rhodobaca bogoriensis DSM 18756]TDW37902.1 manganese/zinc/iron transport system permease protein [Rhodobaca barguzinensis]TDY69928.1 manganese/zinc/iron transport system permease protein [Rhodobaca bogoriensis DSM 18756]